MDIHKPSRTRLNSLPFRRHRQTDSAGSGESGTTTSSSGPLTPPDNTRGFWRCLFNDEPKAIDKSKFVGAMNMSTAPTPSTPTPPSSCPLRPVQSMHNLKPEQAQSKPPAQKKQVTFQQEEQEGEKDDELNSIPALRAKLGLVRNQRDTLRARLRHVELENAGLRRYNAMEVKDAVAGKYNHRRRVRQLEKEVEALKKEVEALQRGGGRGNG